MNLWQQNIVQGKNIMMGNVGEERGAAPQIKLLRRMSKIPGKFYAPQYTKGDYEGLVKFLESW
jgi:hypothetical protein